MTTYAHCRAKYLTKSYMEGWAAHERKDPNISPYGLTEMFERHWWHAGWGDRDIEMGNRVSEGKG